MKFDYKAWYAKNKGRVSGVRRTRYQTDPAYRSQVLAANQRSRDRRRRAAREELMARKRAKKVTTSDGWVEYEIDGKIYLTIGALARVLGRPLKTIRWWLRRGYVPKPSVKLGYREYLYTPEELISIRERLDKLGKLGPATKVVLPEYSAVKALVLKDGVEQLSVLFRCGTLVQACGRSYSTVLLHESMGRIPKTPLYSAGGHRLYSYEMIDVLKKGYEGITAKTRPDWDRFVKFVRDGWERSGWLNAAVITTKSSEVRRYEHEQCARRGDGGA